MNDERGTAFDALRQVNMILDGFLLAKPAPDANTIFDNLRNYLLAFSVGAGAYLAVLDGASPSLYAPVGILVLINVAQTAIIIKRMSDLGLDKLDQIAARFTHHGLAYLIIGSLGVLVLSALSLVAVLSFGTIFGALTKYLLATTPL